MSNSNLRLPFPRLTEVSFCFDTSKEHVDKTDVNETDCIMLLTDEALYDACSTRIAFTSRLGGVSKSPYDALNLSFAVGDDPQSVAANINRLCYALDADQKKLVIPKQVHGNFIFKIDNLSKCDEFTSFETEADGILCTSSNIPVLLCFADCVPVVLVAPTGEFAVVHSGWRGSIASIAGQGLNALACATSCIPSDINCYIGPHIGSCCYEVSGQLIEQFVAQFGDLCAKPKNHLDLNEAVKMSLISAGADVQRIASANICTSCLSDLYFSYRAEDEITGRHGAFAIRKEAS